MITGTTRRDFRAKIFSATPTLVAQVEEIAAEKHCTPAQLALAWVLAQGDDIAPIPGTKRRKYLEENAGALEVNLTAQDLARIDEAAPKGVAAGTRYPVAHDGNGEYLAAIAALYKSLLRDDCKIHQTTLHL